MQKQARQLNIESNSRTFLEAVRCFWMPRLLQKMEQTSSPISTSNCSLTTMNAQGSSAPLSPNPIASSLSPSSIPPRNLLHFESYPTENSSSITSPSIHSSDSLKISELPQVPGQPAGPFHAFGNTVYNTDCHFVDSSIYNMEALNLDPISAMGAYENSLLDCHMADGDWLSDNMAESLWNMNEM